MMERKCSKRLRDLQTFLGHIITSTHTNGMKEDACLEMVGAATNMTGTVGSEVPTSVHLQNGLRRGNCPCDSRGKDSI